MLSSLFFIQKGRYFPICQFPEQYENPNWSFFESGHMILLYDETQIYHLLRELNKLSNYDSMTGLNNRNYIEGKLKKIEETKNIGILSLDLNGLKINNDYLGHERGDYLLKSMANIIKKVFKDIPNKDLGRTGGDEFIIIVYDATNELLKKRNRNYYMHVRMKRLIRPLVYPLGQRMIWMVAATFTI